MRDLLLLLFAIAVGISILHNIYLTIQHHLHTTEDLDHDTIASWQRNRDIDRQATLLLRKTNKRSIDEIKNKTTITATSSSSSSSSSNLN
mmetsp:Transcript_4293/g.6167  ORF Transcript_4293/g.6167 Transcript_4293/m.6167 type:complete len:90 (-) Transcript_4293:231-500(-)